MNAPETNLIPDVQAFPDLRNLTIQKVGVKSIRHPIQIQTPSGIMPTVAMFDMYVSLPPEVKGTHMSRFLEILQTQHAPLSMAEVSLLMQAMLAKLEADSGYIEVRFPYFIEKTAPVSGVKSLMDYDVKLVVEKKAGKEVETTLTVLTPVTSLCPCSKKISAYGAHNQRSHVTIAAKSTGGLWVEDLVAIAEAAASCQLYGILKRADEKYVTEFAYDNPKFVEDLVRDIALSLNKDDRVTAYTIESENFESIHNHSAYALIEFNKTP
jgi:GTP cyclohydrolase IB